ncbi:hypothetical protein ACQKWADRAFT_279052 [Trichoderma austrokoningii]
MDAAGDCNASTRPRTRGVLLVTCPLAESMNKVLSTLGAKIGRKTPVMSAWQPGTHPRVVENLCFARHMAICLIPVKIWHDQSLLFVDKLLAGKFWDHQGSASITKSASCGKHGAAEQWDRTAIESIEAVEVLGTTRLSDDQITEEMFNALFNDWVYLPIWWNCQDFAIRLGYILTPTTQGCKMLNRILHELRRQMKSEVIAKRTSLTGGIFTFQCAGLNLTGSLVTLTSAEVVVETGTVLAAIGTSPTVVAASTVAAPLVPIFGCAALGCGIVIGAYRFVDWRSRNAWESCLSRLESQLPILTDLHAGLRKAYK